MKGAEEVLYCMSSCPRVLTYWYSINLNDFYCFIIIGYSSGLCTVILGLSSFICDT